MAMSDGFALDSPVQFAPSRDNPWRDRRGSSSPKSKKSQEGRIVWAAQHEPDPFCHVISTQIPSHPRGLASSPSRVEEGVSWKDLAEDHLVVQEVVKMHSPKALERGLSESLTNDFTLILGEWGDAVGAHTEHRYVAEASLMREAGLPGLALIFCSIPLIAFSKPIGIAGMFAGSAVFWLANYASYRTGQEDWVVGPAGAAKLFAGSVLLALTAVAAAVTS
jgi:hypothetical protein